MTHPAGRLCQRFGLRAALAAGAGVAIFLADILLPHGYEIAPLYVMPVLAIGITRRKAAVVWLAVAMAGLSSIAAITSMGNDAALHQEAYWFNRASSLVPLALATVVTLALISRYSAAEQARIAAAEADDERRRLFEASAEVGAVGTWTLNIEADNALDASLECRRTFDLPESGQVDMDVVQTRFAERDWHRIRGAVVGALEVGRRYSDEARITTAAGVQRWVHITGEPVFDGEGVVTHVRGTSQDITSWRAAEESAETARRQFAQFSSSLPIGVWTNEPTEGIDFANDRFLDTVGMDLAQISEYQIWDLVHPDEQERVKRWGTARAASDGRFSTETRLRTRDGSFRWHRIALSVERGADNAVVRWWGSAVDIHAQHSLQVRADRLAAERQSILESIADGLYAVDQDWRVIFMNDQATKILRRERSDFLGRVLWDASPHLRGSTVQALYERVMQTQEPGRMEFYAGHIDRWLEVSANPSPLGLTVSVRDVTELRQLSEELAQAARLEALGRLTGGIAHDFNNLLTVVVGAVDALLLDPQLNPDGRDMAALAAEAAARGSELTGRLLAFARSQPLEVKSVDVRRALEDVTPLLKRALRVSITMDEVIAEDIPPVRMDVSQFSTALINLAINANDAMPNGGRLTVTAATCEITEPLTENGATLHPGTYALVTVRDTGEGIDSDSISHVFDPFYTTKAVGEGSGLGLAMVWGFVTQLGGCVSVESAVGVGTTFRLYLPLASANVEHDALDSLSAHVPGRGQGWILMAEDDELVRKFAASRLRNHGYTVVTADSGPEALERLAHMPQCDLLFTDLRMPGGMTGQELASEVTRLRPTTPVLFASGNPGDLREQALPAAVGWELLPKPYSATQLLIQVGEVLRFSTAD